MEKTSGTLTASWLLQILLSVAVSAGAYTIKNINDELASLRDKQHTYTIELVLIRNQLDNLMAAHLREHKLILLMTRKMGIEVPE